MHRISVVRFIPGQESKVTVEDMRREMEEKAEKYRIRPERLEVYSFAGKQEDLDLFFSEHNPNFTGYWADEKKGGILSRLVLNQLKRFMFKTRSFFLDNRGFMVKYSLHPVVDLKDDKDAEGKEMI